MQIKNPEGNGAGRWERKSRERRFATLLSTGSPWIFEWSARSDSALNWIDSNRIELDVSVIKITWYDSIPNRAERMHQRANQQNGKIPVPILDASSLTNLGNLVSLWSILSNSISIPFFNNEFHSGLFGFVYFLFSMCFVPFFCVGSNARLTAAVINQWANTTLL